ncbi:hypothetical protein M407DRAFT_29564, partial [Tulasnella calospora MUT 4182]
SSNRPAQLGVADERLLHILLRGVSAYHPWTWYLPSIIVDLPGEVVEGLAGRGPTFVARIAGVGGAFKRPAHEQTVQRRAVVARPVKRPTLASCIDRHGGPPKPAVQEHVLPKRPQNPPGWIEKFTLEGRVLVYSGCPTPNGPAEWVLRFDPRSGYHLTESGDESSNLQRDMADGYLLNIILRGVLIYHPSVVYLPVILLNVPGEIVKAFNILALTNDSLDLTTAATTTAIELLLYRPGIPEVTTIIDYAAPSIYTTAAFVRLDTRASHVVPVALDQRENRSCAVDEAVYAKSAEDVETSEETGSFTSNPDATSSSSRPQRTSQDIARLGPTSDPLLDGPRAAGVQELRSLLPLLEERAGQRHALRAWENTWTRATEQDRVEETRTEDDGHHDEVHTRRKRRGGKKNMCWKNKRRQDKDENERHPEAGPSGLR